MVRVAAPGQRQLSGLILCSKKEKDIKEEKRGKNRTLSVFREDLWKLPHEPLLMATGKSHCYI